MKAAQLSRENPLSRVQDLNMIFDLTASPFLCFLLSLIGSLESFKAAAVIC